MLDMMSVKVTAHRSGATVKIVYPGGRTKSLHLGPNDECTIEDKLGIEELEAHRALESVDPEFAEELGG